MLIIRSPSRVLGLFLFVAVFLFLGSRVVLTRHHVPSSALPHHVPSSALPQHRIRFKPSTFEWKTVKEHHPVTGPIQKLPNGLKPLPAVQHAFRSSGQAASDSKNKPRREAVRNAFRRCWESYKTHAWLHDELAPVSGGAKDTFGGWAATLVDSLDTLFIMGFHDEFTEAAAAAAALDWSNTTETAINLFETTIRHLGGLLSAYDLSGEEALLKKANELGDMLYMAFDTPNRMPGFWFTFDDAKNGTQLAGTNDPSASPTSLAMEFTRLAQLTGKHKYYDAAHRVKLFLQRTQEDSVLPGMWPRTINFRDEIVRNDNGFTLGALADSLYEYLLKNHILLGGADSSWGNMYKRAMQTVIKHVLFRPMTKDPGHEFLFAGTAFVYHDHVDHVPEGQHLACFVGGMFAMGGRIFDIPEHVDVGRQLALGCAWAYSAFPTRVMPEIFGLIRCPGTSLEKCEWDPKRWENEGMKSLNQEGFTNAREPRYALRPEAIESLFVLYRVTGDEMLRDAAWDMFESIMRSTSTDLGNSGIADVTVTGETEKLDEMESFWMSETLKYFYLIFSPPDVISLDEYVFSTEAHPFKRPGRDFPR